MSTLQLPVCASDSIFLKSLLSGPWALCTLLPLSGKHPRIWPVLLHFPLLRPLPAVSGIVQLVSPSRVGPDMSRHQHVHGASGPGTQEALSKCSAKGSRTPLSSWIGVSVLSSTRANHPARQTVFTNQFLCVLRGHRSSPTMANKTRQVSALEASGDPRDAAPKGDGATAVTARTASAAGTGGGAASEGSLRGACEPSRSGHMIYPSPAGKRKEERDPRVKKRGTLMLALLTPAPSAPPRNSLLSPPQGGYAWQDPWEVPPEHSRPWAPGGAFSLTTLRGRDPQWARCTETITPSSLPKPLEITLWPLLLFQPLQGDFRRPLTPRALNWAISSTDKKASRPGRLLTRLTPLLS